MSVANLIARTRSLIGRNAGMFVTAALLLAAASTAADTWLEESAAAVNLPLGIASLFAQYAVTREALLREGLLVPDAPKMRFGAIFVVGFLTNAGILLGVVLLVLPGLYLAARWAMAVPILVGENTGAGEAIGTSWRRTRDHAAPIAGTLLLLIVPVVLVFGAVRAFEQIIPQIVLNAVLNAAVYGAIVTGWYLAVAIHAGLSPPPHEHLAEVFA